MPKASMLQTSGRLWYPSADVYKTREGWVVKVELAGVSSEEIELTVAEDTLHLSCCRRDHFCSETLFCHQLEITYSRFEKTIRFPCPIEGAHIEANYRDGLLLIALRVPEECEAPAEVEP